MPIRILELGDIYLFTGTDHIIPSPPARHNVIVDVWSQNDCIAVRFSNMQSKGGQNPTWHDGVMAGLHYVWSKLCEAGLTGGLMPMPVAADLSSLAIPDTQPLSPPKRIRRKPLPSIIYSANLLRLNFSTVIKRRGGIMACVEITKPLLSTDGPIEAFGIGQPAGIPVQLTLEADGAGYKLVKISEIDPRHPGLVKEASET